MSKNKHKHKKRPRNESYYVTISNPNATAAVITINDKTGEIKISEIDEGSGKFVTSYKR